MNRYSGHRVLPFAVVGFLGALACVPALGDTPTVGVLWPEPDAAPGVRTGRGALLDALKEQFRSGRDLALRAVSTDDQATRRAAADAGVSPKSLGPALPAEDGAKLAQALALDWLLMPDLREFHAPYNLVQARARLLCRLVHARSAQEEVLDIVKTVGDRQGLQDLPPMEGVWPEDILAMVLVDRLAPRLLRAMAQLSGAEPVGPVEPPVEPVEPPIGPVEPVEPPVEPAEPPVEPVEPPVEPGPSAPGPPAVDPGLSGPELIIALERRLATEGDSAALRIQLGEVCLAQGLAGPAERHFKRAIELDPRQALPHLRLGRACMQGGRWHEAITHYSAAVELEPDNTAARLEFAKALERANRPREAEEHFRFAVSLAPDDGAAALELGDFLQRQHDDRGAEQAWLQAAAASSPDPRSYARLADYYADRGRFKEAFEYQLRASHDPAGPLHMDARRYVRTMAAADAALATQMNQSRSLMQRYRRSDLTREEAFYAFQQFADYSGDLYNLADSIVPPLEYSSRHDLRLLVYSLVRQADLAILDYLESNDDTKYELAHSLRAEAVNEFDRLAAAVAGSG